MSELTRPEREILLEVARRANYKMAQYFQDTGPFSRAHYPKHIEFFDAGAQWKERLFMAANRVGKSEAGAYEVTLHLTGLYPPWWTGRRFTEPVDAWACGTNSETTRDIVQEKLFGKVTEFGSGMVPSHLIIDHNKRPHGLPGSIESVWVRHVTGGVSVIGLKTYEQGRTSFEGTAKHVVWCDEEPPADCYTEMLYRTITTKGIVLVTFTPLQGMSEVVTGFLDPENDDARAFKMVVQAGWDDVVHLDEAEKKALLATTPPFQREARTKGTPQLGAGAIYQYPASDLTVNPFELPKHWPRCYGMDTDQGAGWTAVVWLALDRDTRTVYLYDGYKRQQGEPAIHAAAVLARGKWICGVADSAGLAMTAHDAEQLVTLYRRLGLDINLPDKAVETGIQEVWELISAGRFKVFSSCSGWFDEYRLYHRDEKGRIVKTKDHYMDATRYAVRSGLKRAKTEPVAAQSIPRADYQDPASRRNNWLGQ